MASKRKSTTPCMIPVKTLVLQETELDAVEDDPEGTQQDAPAEGPAASDAGASNSNNGALSNGHRGISDSDTYICKFCDFGSQEVHQFFGHLDSEHLDFSKDPAFACVACNFLANSHEGLSHHNAEAHAGETSFIWRVAKQDNRTTVEQSLCEAGSSHDLPGEVPEEGVDGQSEIIITKTPIMKIMKGKPEAKKIHTLKENVSSQLGSESEVKDGEHSFPNGSVPVSQPAASSTKSSHIVNGSIIGNVPVLPAGVAQLVSLQQQPPLHQQLPTSKSLPKVMIPLSSIPTYNAAMDSNSFLKNSFHKFPYPTKAELCYLTVVTKYPEEQLKIWFTAQRLKQGISWSPEEIEDARKKMFNTVIQSVPQPTITVLNTPLVANPGSVPHLIQATLPGHVVGQPEGTGGLLVTQPIMANGLKGTSSSFTLAVTSVPKPQPAPQHSTVSSSNASGVKVVNSGQSLLTACPTISSQTFLDPNVYKNKKSHEQLSALKGSFCRNQFPGQAEVERLTKITGLSTKEIRKWFSDRRYHYRNVRGGRAVFPGDSALDSLPEITFDVSPRGAELSPAAAAAVPAPHHPPRRQSWHQAPDFTPTKYKERAPEQLKALESSFAQNPLPAEEEVNRLRGETKMTRREIDSWFSERRKKKVAEENKKVEEVARQEEEEAENGGREGEDSSDELRAASENGSVDASGNNPNSVERKVSPIKINLKNLRVTESNGKSELPGGAGANEKGDSSSNRPPTPPKTKLNFKKTAQQRHLLKQMFVQTQRPTNQEYDAIVSQTGLPRAEVIRWFGDSRYGYKNGQLKWYENYRRGVFPPGLVEVSPASREVLEDYYEKHKGLREEDLPGLCECSHLSAQQLKVWFAMKAEEESRGAVSEEACASETVGSRKGPCEAGSEVMESSESWEPGGKEGSAGAPDAPGPPPATRLGKAPASGRAGSAGGFGR
ncbi:zinc fingers and homeoboxes protein 3 isoform X1 [Grus americana]|uniref:zinc fingers and homeoboxes protein 3 isoform X1 n=1 Tax=Grus americana TaxID=9117 RepID=UPI00240787EC|nr:zinc fingers and homeoboxes protein 3 isoform X1 [Grus americana]XP_054701295.1 zinc fingers and homeoboxes protein 3 isoform X1 [Grus americana]XP_054701296.1 zinc fingers and homeoboxes protein 3 isoform X1 [Grus americana]XP_054701297.1 zinc fingers and homeoboxes protein 3 isoform X1 [Grus americana]XP_054701298.1 zinc fingers and homeoboxes protein 3 isoform X1 [Grus americana]XP_054701299.1 zinc fingers and homeoboxes protein 3 isoform X1 [Grus americana]XP_054701300.1 zinc fingers a